MTTPYKAYKDTWLLMHLGALSSTHIRPDTIEADSTVCLELVNLNDDDSTASCNITEDGITITSMNTDGGFGISAETLLRLAAMSAAYAAGYAAARQKYEADQFREQHK